MIPKGVPMISKRASEFTSFIVMDVMAKAEELERKGEHIIHLEVGEPDFPTPKVIADTAIAALQSDRTRYTHALGLLELRAGNLRSLFEGIRRDDYARSGNDLNRNITGIAFCDAGHYRSRGRSDCFQPPLSLLPEFHSCRGRENQGDSDLPGRGISIPSQRYSKETYSRRTRGIIINSPCNPTGIVMTPDQLKDIAQFEGQYIISDEIYHGLVYKDRAHSILEFTDRAFVINGFSKLYAMTGWRLGYLIFPKKFSAVMQRIHQNFMISANAFIQWAGIAALTQAQDDVAGMVKTYDERRRYMIDRLKDMGFMIHVEPTGAFYVFADGRKFFKDSYKEAFRITEEAKVGVTPGIDFGSGGEGFLRFSYATSLENIKEGLNRLEKYLKKKSNH